MGKEKEKSKKKKILIISSIVAVVIIAIVVAIILIKGNNSDNKSSEFGYNTKIDYSNFFVEYFKAEKGDCSLIHFDNGKVMMIDVGSSKSTLTELQEVFEKLNITTIDYLVLTHPDNAHIGNTLSLLDNYNIKTCYIPDVSDELPFTDFFNIKQELTNKNVELKISKTGVKFSEGKSNIYFLSPMPRNEKDSSYDEIRLDIVPTEEHIDNLSPVIFIEYNGKSFLFAGDNRSGALESVIGKMKTGIYDGLFREKIYLQNIDFMLMPNGGRASSNSEDVITYFNPQNAIISADGSDGDDYISSAVIERLKSVNTNVNILLTQQVGSVRVCISEDSEITIITDKDLNV